VGSSSGEAKAQEGIGGRRMESLLFVPGVGTDSPRDEGPEDGLVSDARAFGHGPTSEVTAGGHRAPKGVPIAVEGNPLQGEAHGCSGAFSHRQACGAERRQGSQDPVVKVAKEVVKPLRGTRWWRDPPPANGSTTLACAEG
jgi:hypothetical protein